MGKAAEHLGPGGAGSLMKLAVNSMLIAGVQALAEAVALGERGGLDRKRFLDVLGQTAAVSPGSGPSSPTLRRTGTRRRSRCGRRRRTWGWCST